MKFRRITRIMMALTLALLSGTVLASRSGEINRHVNALTKGNPDRQIQTCKDLQFAGLSSTSIYDLAEKKLLRKYQDKPADRHDADHTAWLVKCLQASGNSKYKKTLQKVESSGYKKYRKRATQALEMLPKYTKWNPIISSGMGKLSGKEGKKHRYINMIKSSDIELKAMGAKRVHYEHLYDSAVLSTLNSEIKKGYKKANSKESADTYSWMVKALAGSRKTMYRSTVAEVADNGPDRKLQKNARKYLKYYDK